MKRMVSVICLVAVISLTVLLTGCGDIATVTTTGSSADRRNTKAIADALSYAQPTPTDINYSLERFNLIRRAYWVNGQREKAATVICPVERPLGYIVLITESGAVAGRFVVDGKVSSLNSYLTPDSEYYEVVYGGNYTEYNRWLPDIDGSYGENDSGIFFFTPDGKYVEWSGIYLYSDIPFEISNPMVTYSTEQ